MANLPPQPPPIRKLQTQSKGSKPKPTPRRSERPSLRPRRAVRKELSAGGVVARQERGSWYVALLKTEHKRGEVWVLPKGHVEPHNQETVAEAARREVEEEAGVKDLAVKDQLGVAKFQFQAETALVRKTVHYYLMVTNQKKLVPQAEEGFIDAQWFPIDLAIETLEYDTDQDVVGKARFKLTGQRLPHSRRTQTKHRTPNRRHIKIRV